MQYIVINITIIILLFILPLTTEADNTTIPEDTIGLIYFLPSDRTAQADIDSNINTWIKETQTAIADLMEAHGYGRKTFKFQTDDNGDAVVHHVTGKNTDAYYETESKWKVWFEIKDAGFDSKHTLFVAFVDLSSERIDTYCGTGGDSTDANGGVVTLPASGGCFVKDDLTNELRSTNLIAHQLGYAFGLRPNFVPYSHRSDSSANLTLVDDMITSTCSTKWLDGNRYFNSYTESTTEKTQIELATPSGDYENISFTFTITDADGLHQSHFLLTRDLGNDVKDLRLLDCKTLEDTSESVTAVFTTSSLSVSTDSVTLRVMDGTGSMTEKLFPVNLVGLFSDLNKDGVVNILDLTLIALKVGQVHDGPEDINGDDIVNVLDLILAASALGSVGESPSLFAHNSGILTDENLHKWIKEAREMNLKDPILLEGLKKLENITKELSINKTALLPNYPNPFNPETWIPYQLSKASDVTITIYNMRGVVVRKLALGHQKAGYYTNRNRAAYWDGRNSISERVASGVYFATFKAGDYTATRKMLIRK